VPGEVPGKRAVIDVVAATGAAADQEVDLPALVEFLHRLGGSARRWQKRRDAGAGERKRNPAAESHQGLHNLGVVSAKAETYSH
jgi:hypothetical protein